MPQTFSAHTFDAHGYDVDTLQGEEAEAPPGPTPDGPGSVDDDMSSSPRPGFSGKAMGPQGTLA